MILISFLWGCSALKNTCILLNPNWLDGQQILKEPTTYFSKSLQLSTYAISCLIFIMLTSMKYFGQGYFFDDYYSQHPIPEIIKTKINK